MGMLVSLNGSGIKIRITIFIHRVLVVVRISSNINNSRLIITMGEVFSSSSSNSNTNRAITSNSSSRATTSIITLHQANTIEEDRELHHLTTRTSKDQ